MLRMLDKNDTELIKELTCRSLLGTRIYCYALCYGFGKSFVDFWASDSAVVARFENTYTIKAKPETDCSELREFIDILGASQIVTDESTALSMGFSDADVKSGYLFSSDICPEDDAQELDERLIPELYSIISEAIPDSFGKDKNSYLSFLSDYMYRKNRGFSRAFGVIDEGSLVSTAITSAETEDSAIISGVACKSSCRKFGYGKKTVLTLVSALKKQNKNVYVIALNDSAKGFYEHIGFAECEKIAYISKKV